MKLTTEMYNFRFLNNHHIQILHHIYKTQSVEIRTPQCILIDNYNDKPKLNEKVTHII